MSSQSRSTSSKRYLPGPCNGKCGRSAMATAGPISFCRACRWLRRTLKDEGVRSFAALLRKNGK